MSQETTQLALTTPTVPATTPMRLLEIAPSTDIDKLIKMWELQQEWEKHEAKKAFVAAMSAFKSHAIVLTKDKENLQYKSRYATLGNMVATVTPYLSQHGLSAGWNIDQTSGIKVTCIITHSLGHSESVSMTCPPDTSGAKNPIQQIKSAITYAKACTFESICGLASTDANLDDDGNFSGGRGMDPDTLQNFLDGIMGANNAEQLKETYMKGLKVAEAAGDNAAKTKLAECKNTRFRQLPKEAR